MDQLQENAATAAAMAAVDAIAAAQPPPAPTQARGQIQVILNAIPRPAGAPGLAVNERELTTEQLNLQLQSAGFATIFVWLLISFITGLFLLILNKPSFGVPMDYIFCLLWAFGVSVTGSISQNPATSLLGIKMPEKL